MKPHIFSFSSMGTEWEITIWDTIAIKKLRELEKKIISSAKEFDQTYSRFIKTSLVKKIEHETGVVTVPKDFTRMLFIYKTLYHDSNSIINPLIGQTISDLGYDDSYSLVKKAKVRKTPIFIEAIEILDDNHIKKNIPCLFDLGAIGKGYFVDLVSTFLYTSKLRHFLINGSGDIYYQGETVITAGLEHPDDPKKIIGSIDITTGALCASATNRRKWKGIDHIINPISISQKSDIIATWVYSDSCTISDGIATALFFSPPENFLEDFKFEYLILNKDYKVKKSNGFNAKLY